MYICITPVEGIAERVTGRISIDVEVSHQRALCRTLVSLVFSRGLKVPEVAPGTRPDTLVQSHRFRRVIALIGNSKPPLSGVVRVNGSAGPCVLLTSSFLENNMSAKMSILDRSLFHPSFLEAGHIRPQLFHKPFQKNQLRER